MSVSLPPTTVDDSPAKDRRRVSKAIALIVPLGLLVLVQWPLRGMIDDASRYTGNIAQIIFGIYAAFAINAASRSKSHLAFVKYGETKNAKPHVAWQSWARLACILPWALLMLWTGVPQMVQSIASLEQFKEGGSTQGYFLLRIALVLLTALALANAVGDVYFERKRRKQITP